MSLSPLKVKRQLQDYAAARKNQTSSYINEIEPKNIKREELDGLSCVFGHRAPWHNLRQKFGLCISRTKVQSMLKKLDPVGTDRNRKRYRLKRKTRAYRSVGTLVAMTNRSNRASLTRHQFPQ